MLHLISLFLLIYQETQEEHQKEFEKNIIEVFYLKGYPKIYFLDPEEYEEYKITKELKQPNYLVFITQHKNIHLLNIDSSKNDWSKKIEDYKESNKNFPKHIKQIWILPKEDYNNAKIPECLKKPYWKIAITEDNKIHYINTLPQDKRGAKKELKYLENLK